MLNSYGSVTKIKDKINKDSEQRTNVCEIQVIYGDENIKGVLNEITSNCKSDFFLYGTKNLFTVIFGIPSYREILTSLQNSKVKIKLLTEITADNLEYFKQFMKDFGAEIRHLKGIKGNFAVTTELYIAFNAFEEKKPIIELIRSNIKNVVEHNYLDIFDTLWKNAIPAEQKIQQIQEKVSSTEPNDIKNTANFLNYVIDLVENTRIGLSSCTFKRLL